MPQLSRSDMHIMLDVALEVLQGSQFNRLDAPVKDIWLNATIDDFVKETVDAANRPNPTKRLPNGVLLYKDILSKYNDIRTLIHTSELINGSDEIYILISSIIGNGTTITVTSTKYHGLTTGDRVVVDGVSGGSGTWNGTFTVTVTNTTTFTFSSTGNGTPTFTATSIRYEYSREYKAFLLPTTPTMYHFETSSSLVSPITCNKQVTIPNELPDVYDIAIFNINPYGGKGRLIATSLINNELRLYTLGRYIVYKVNITYIKAPAKLTSSPDVVNCDLPDQIHTKIVELTARKIAAYNNNDNYQPIATEINSPVQ